MIQAIKEINERWDELQSAYDSFIEKKAAQVFESRVKPFLIENGFNFYSGNGTYLVQNPRLPDVHRQDHVDVEEMDEEIAEILNSYIPNYPADIFGAWMPNFDFKKYSESKNIWIEYEG